MSHYAVLVIGDNVTDQLEPYQSNSMNDCPKEYLRFSACPKAGGDSQWFDSEEAARQALGEQYDEDDSGWWNPETRWDYYCLGGRWMGFFKLKPGASGELGSFLWDDNAEIRLAGRADCCSVDAVDFDTPREEARARAESLYAKFEALAAEHGMPQPVSYFEAKGLVGHDAVVAYRKQPVLRELRGELPELWTTTAEEVFGPTKEAFIRRLANAVYAPYAVVMGGRWYDRDKPDWAGRLHATRESWDAAFQSLLSELPAGTDLTLLDCHR